MQVATSLTLLQETIIQPPTEVVRVNGGKFSGEKKYYRRKFNGGSKIAILHIFHHFIVKFEIIYKFVK